MTSGNVLYSQTARAGVTPATLFATPDTRAGGSAPAEATPVADFDDTTIEYEDFYWRVPEHYAGGGLTLGLEILMTSATSGNLIMGAAIRRIERDAEDLDASHTYDYNDSSATAVANVAGESVNVAITFTSGTDMDSVAAGEWAILRIRRNASSGSDTASGDAELLGLVIKET